MPQNERRQSTSTQKPSRRRRPHKAATAGRGNRSANSPASDTSKNRPPRIAPDERRQSTSTEKAFTKRPRAGQLFKVRRHLYPTSDNRSYVRFGLGFHRGFCKFAF